MIDDTLIHDLLSQNLLKQCSLHDDTFIHLDSSIVFTKDSRILCRSGLPIKYCSISDIPLDSIQGIQYCYDGTLVRLYFDGKEWITSTLKTVDAKNSYFSSHKSYDTLFWESFGSKDILSTFDPSVTYTFILLHPDNVHIIPCPTKQLIFIEALSNSPGFVPGDLSRFKVPIDICTDFSLVTDKLSFILDIPELDTMRGIILFSSDTKYILDFKRFVDLKKIRGNHPDIIHRYIQFLVRNKVQLLRDSFPAFKNDFDLVDRVLFKRWEFTGKPQGFFKNPNHLYNLFYSFKYNKRYL